MRTIFNTRHQSDPGLGSGYSKKGVRVINKDGSLNITRRGVIFNYQHLFHWLIEMSWLRFFGLILLLYFVTNSLFAGVYLLAGMEHVQGFREGTPVENFFQAFFFSAQTFTTVGYGALAPTGMLTSFIASVESMAGLLGFAIATGILYGRFSRPSAQILFADQAVIAPYLDLTALMVRIVNGRSSQMMDLKAVLLMTWVEGSGSEQRRMYRSLKLERETVYMFPLTWTIVHPIDEESPLWGKNASEVADMQAEVIVLVQGYDETFSQTVHTRSSYVHTEIEWDAKFISAQTTDEDGWVTLHVDKVGLIEKLDNRPGKTIVEKGSNPLSRTAQ